MVLYNYKDGYGEVHVLTYASVSGSGSNKRFLCSPRVDMLCGTKVTRENVTCEKCLREIKYAVIIAKYLAKGGYGS